VESYIPYIPVYNIAYIGYHLIYRVYKGISIRKWVIGHTPMMVQSDNNELVGGCWDNLCKKERTSNKQDTRY
jgi:hypothetical protein